MPPTPDHHPSLHPLKENGLVGITLAAMTLGPFCIVPTFVNFADAPPRAAILGASATALTAWFLLTFRTPRLSIRLDRLTMAVVFFLAWCWASLLWAHNPYEVLSTVIPWTACSVFYFLLQGIDWQRRGGLLPILQSAVSLAVAGIAVVGLCQALFGLALIPQAHPPASAFANKNFAVHLLVMGLPFCFIGIVGAFPLLLRLWSAAASVLGTVYLVLTFTRAGWLAFAVMAVFLAGYAFYRYRCYPPINTQAHARRWILPVSVLVALVVCIWIVTVLGPGETVAPVSETAGSLAQIVEDPMTASKGRLGLWANSMAMWLERPLLGFGLGNQKVHYPPFQKAWVDMAFSIGKQLHHAHNDFIQLAVETGLIGLGLFLAVLFFGIRGGLQAARLHMGSPVEGLALAAVTGLLGFMVVAFFSFPLYRPLPPLWLFVFLGLIASLRHHTVNPPKELRRLILRRAPMLAVCLLAAIPMLFLGVRAVQGESQYSLLRHHGESGNWPMAIQAGQRARELTPWHRDNTAFLAAALLENGDLAGGQSVLEDFVALYPYHVKSWENLGNTKAALGNTEAAQACFDTIIAFKPDYAPAYFHKGLLFFHAGQLQEAAAWFQEAIDADSKYADAHYHLGLAGMLQEDYDNAAASYQEALRLAPAMESARGNLAVVLYQNMNRPAEGYNQMRIYLDHHPQGQLAATFTDILKERK